MAVRPIYCSSGDPPLVIQMDIHFEWHPGFSPAQKQKSIRSLHEAARRTSALKNVLEVSSRSSDSLGRSLSAFSLSMFVPGVGAMSLESAFQGSKVFSVTGPLSSAYELAPREAKAAARDVNSREALIGFQFDGTTWDIEPKTWFYDWLYLSALRELPANNLRLLSTYDAFTDIEFNPAKSFNCQARSCAIASALIRRGELDKAVEDRQFLRSVAYPDVSAPSPKMNQESLL